jgi:glycerol kinase
MDQMEHKQILLADGWVEHDALEIWDNSNKVIEGALKKAGIIGSDLTAIGITNQRETVLAWNKETGLPLANAIVWQDIRTKNELEKLSESQKERIQVLSGLPASPYFSASKMKWLIENSLAVRDAKADDSLVFGTMDTWLLWNLTGGANGGVFATDVTNASRTLLMDIEKLEWNDELLDIFKIQKSTLPSIKSSSEIYGHTLKEGVFGSEVPIAGILGDQQAAMVGQGCFETGDSKCTYGTGNFALVNTGTQIVRSEKGLLTTVCYKFGTEEAKYALEGSVAVTGAAVQWLRDQLELIKSADEIEELAKKVSDNGGVYFVPAFSGLFAPHWRSDARGVIVGLTRSATKAHLARAALEAICYQSREVLVALAAESGVQLKQLRVDGGITNNNLCMQLQADILQIEIVRPEIVETTALGAAYAAGLAVGYWGSTEEVKAKSVIANKWSPVKGSELATKGFEQWGKAVSKTLNWID